MIDIHDVAGLVGSDVAVRVVLDVAGLRFGVAGLVVLDVEGCRKLVALLEVEEVLGQILKSGQ